MSGNFIFQEEESFFLHLLYLFLEGFKKNICRARTFPPYIYVAGKVVLDEMAHRPVSFLSFLSQIMSFILGKADPPSCFL